MLLDVKNLGVEFHTYDGIVRAVNGIDFSVDKGEILGIVGESGSGKSVATHAILQLLPVPPGKIFSGEIFFEGKDLLKMSDEELDDIRGKDIGMIFQEPMTSLNPVYTVEDQIVESLKLHLPGMSKSEYIKRAIDSLRAVGIPSPETRLKCYPHELSGGMRQRVMIAMSLVCNPKLLIADEPTTALDVTIQAQILDIINDLRKKYGLAVILITHDLGVIAETADRVMVMYAGRVVESGTVKDIFDRPMHPYTLGLLASIPSYFDAHEELATKEEILPSGKKLLKTIRGMVPDMRQKIVGCPFFERCDFADDSCKKAEPQLNEVSAGHKVACFKRGQ